MPRWLRWTTGVLLLVGVCATALVIRGPDPPPYNFLPRDARVDVPLTAEDAEEYGYAPLAYSFKADYDAVKKLALVELAKHDYVEFAPFSDGPGNYSCIFVQKKSLGISGGSGEPPHKNAVSIRRDVRITDTTKPMHANEAPGWVTVELFGEREMSFLDRLRAALGL